MEAVSCGYTSISKKNGGLAIKRGGTGWWVPTHQISVRKALPFSGLPKPALAPRALAGIQVLEID